MPTSPDSCAHPQEPRRGRRLRYLRNCAIVLVVSLLTLTLQGEARGRTPDDPREANAWTARYPTRALFPIKALVDHVRGGDMFGRIGSVNKMAIVVDYSESTGQHVLAGSIRAPKATAPMAGMIVQWVRSLP